MTSPGKRYAQCDDTCTTDCGHCKGNGPARVSPWPYGDAVQPDIEDDEPPAEAQQDDERDRYGHTAADHKATGACQRPSMDARVAASATEYPRGSDLAVAFERGWDAHRLAYAARLRAALDAR